MTDKPTGGSAFPVAKSDLIRGLTIRDWFAGQALALSGEFFHCIDDHQNDPPNEVKHTAFIAYAIADAMLQEREK